MKIINIDRAGPIGFTADHHIGNHGVFGGKLSGGLNNRCRYTLASLRAACTLLREQSCAAHVLLGDLFDTAKPRPAILRQTQRVIRRAKLPSVALIGNHDLSSDSPDDNALAPLAPVLHVVREPTIVRTQDAEVWCIPYQSSEYSFVEQAKTHLPSFADQRERDRVVLGLHVGIADKHTPPWLKNSDHLPLAIALKWLKEFDIDRIIAGDWHDHQSWGERVIQCGALTPTGFDNPGSNFGQVHIFDPESNTMNMCQVPGPRFIRTRSIDDLDLPDSGGIFYVDVTTTSDRYSAEKQAADELVSSKVIAGARVRIDANELRDNARTAARCVRTSETIATACNSFVQSMTLVDVDRERVQARVTELLREHQSEATSGLRSVAVSKIQVARFAAYEDEQTLSLPSSGLVVITGNNGEGKTALIEAVAHAGWDHSIKDRAKGCWRILRDGSEAGIELADGTWIIRQVTANRSKRVRLIHPGKPNPDFDRPTKMAPAVEAMIGDFQIWRATCVFTSSSGSFTSATDSERKRMLERVLELSVFDRALDAARAEIKTTEAQIIQLRQDLALGRQKLESLQARIQDASRELESLRSRELVLTLPSKPELPEPLVVLDSELDVDALTNAVKDFEARSLALADCAADLRARISQIKREIRSLDTSTECPTCGAPLDATHAKQRASALTSDLKTLEATLTREQGSVREADRQLAEARQRLSDAREDQRARQHNAERKTAWQRRCEAWGRDCDRAREAFSEKQQAHEARISAAEVRKGALEMEHFDVEDQVLGLEVDLEAGSFTLAELKACEVALGLRGIRANLMVTLLSTIESLANRWLEDLGDMRVKLRPWTPGSKGTVKDEIHLEIEGAGGGRYGDCSQGQQRRIDIAILLALSEAVGGLGSEDTSTLFFDEVFDALDPPGRVAMAKLIRELSRERTCVVITHVPELAQELRADKLIEVRGGRLIDRSRSRLALAT